MQTRPQRAPAAAPPIAVPPIRIRTLLLLGVLGWSVWWLWPRASAAWQLYNAAPALANYGLCMVGPTGAGLVRDAPRQFERLLQRRLVAAPPNERLFERCAPLARAVVGSTAAPELERVYAASAQEFAEFGMVSPTPPEFSLQQVELDTSILQALTERAWPLVRHGYRHLVKPSRAAHEALHPVELPRPAAGTGLPRARAAYRSVAALSDSELLLAQGAGATLFAYRSRDAGVTWKASLPGHSALSEIAERCPAGDGKSFTFIADDAGERLYVSSTGPDAAPWATELAAKKQLVAAACDTTVLIAALKDEDSDGVTLRLCPFRAACRPLAAPTWAGKAQALRFPLDVARVAGASVVALSTQGVVRVASSRDDGLSWTPFSVVYDAREYPELAFGTRVPDRLLTIGTRVLLYGGAERPQERYPVLVSVDQGASWQSPEVLAAAREVAHR